MIALDDLLTARRHYLDSEGHRERMRALKLAFPFGLGRAKRPDDARPVR